LTVYVAVVGDLPAGCKDIDDGSKSRQRAKILVDETTKQMAVRNDVWCFTYRPIYSDRISRDDLMVSPDFRLRIAIVPTCMRNVRLGSLNLTPDPFRSGLSSH